MVISAEIEHIWLNTLAQGNDPIAFNGDFWQQGLGGLDQNGNGTQIPGDYLQTAAPPLGAITDGLGLMGSTTEQARFIRGLSPTGL